MTSLSIADLLALPATLDVPTAGRAYGIGQRLSYELARRGEFPVPVLKLGRALRVRRADLVADLLGATPDSSEAALPGAAVATTTDEPMEARDAVNSATSSRHLGLA